MNRYLNKLLILVVMCFGLTGCSGETKQNTGTETTQIQTSQQTTVANAVDALEFNESEFVERREDDNEILEEDMLEVHYIDVGQGDAILLKQGDAAMLIDAGNNDKGSKVWSYLLSQNIEALNYAIGTHPDADHIGGLDVVLYKFDCDTIFLPACENDTKTYEDLVQTIGQRNQKVIVPKRGDTYLFGKAQFQILTDTGKEYGENINDHSIALRLTFGNTSFLFTGDAEQEAEQDMLACGLSLSADVYKVAHHGADTASTTPFLKAVNPEYSVISCGQDNTYGHPRAGVLNDLRAMGVSVFRTDEQGTVVAVSDGNQITFNCSPSESWEAGEPVGSGTTQVKDKENDTEKNETESEMGYVLNTNTGKFHRPDCSSVKRMADQNKRVSDKLREELIADGYEPCKNCNP